MREIITLKASPFLDSVSQKRLEQGLKLVPRQVNDLFDESANKFRNPTTEDMEAFMNCFDLIDAKGLMNSISVRFLSSKTLLEEQLGERLSSALDSHSIDALRSLSELWKEYSRLLRWANFMFSELVSIPSVTTAATRGDAFLSEVWNARTAYQTATKNNRQQMATTILHNIHLARCSDAVDTRVTQLLAGILLPLVGSSGYRTLLETPYIERTCEHYLHELKQSSLINAVDRMCNYLEIESTFIKSYLMPTTYDKLGEALQSTIMSYYRSQLSGDISGTISALLNSQRYPELGWLLSNAKYARLICRELRSHLLLCCEELKQKSENQSKSDYILSHLGFITRWTSLNDKAFKKSKAVAEIIREIFSTFFQDTLDEELAQFCDVIIKKGSVTSDVRDSIAYWVKYISGDVFESYFIRLIAKRLLLSNDTAKASANESILTPFIVESSRPSTRNRIKHILQDVENWSQIQAEFNEFLAAISGTMPLKHFTVQLLSIYHWPSFRQDELVLPEIVKQSMEMFTMFHEGHNPNTTLKWVNYLGRATLKYSRSSQSKILTTTPYQACFLLLFNECEAVTIEQAAKLLGLPLSEVVKIAQTLLHPEARILTTNDTDLQPSAELGLNKNFQHPQAHIRLPNSVGPIQVPQQDKSIQLVRVVKILKDKKEIRIADLTRELKTEPSRMGSIINDLTDRGYVNRKGDLLIYIP